MKIKKGDKVAIQYVGTFDNGEVFDSNVHGDHAHPLEFEVGAGQVIPGFDKAVEGMKKDEEKKFRIPAEEAYGEKREELIKAIPRPENFPEQAKEGMMIGVGPAEDKQIPALIVKITDKEVTLDLNHPFAGKALNFNIKILGINEPSLSHHHHEHNQIESLDDLDESEKASNKKVKKRILKRKIKL
jgi:FKBP-type peptidyl-prolyl cis-trans isomerase 2